MTSKTFANYLYSDRYTTSGWHEQNEYHTHVSKKMEKLHAASMLVGQPASLCTQLLARVIQPLPGEDKDHYLKGMGIRIGAFALFLISIPFGICSFLISFSLQVIDHRDRPAISYLKTLGVQEKSLEELLMSKDNPLHIRTHNAGFVPTAVSTVGDLRHPTTRAQELAKSVLNDPDQPDLIFMNEMFHEEASKIFIEEVKSAYPHIVHNIAPSITGFSSGVVVLSKYPIETIEFMRLDHMLGPERLSPRGILCVKIHNIFLYNVHMQALFGEGRAKARLKQLKDIKTFMETHKQSPQVLLGDFNTSQVTAWGESNNNQADNVVLTELNQNFNDLFLKDHDEIGQRKKGTTRQYPDHLPEPRGSWYHGPFAQKGHILSLKMWLDRYFNHRSKPEQIVSVSQPTWGTPSWQSDQTANTARFDYIVLPKYQTLLDGCVEIRRVAVAQNAQSAPTDHLPVDARIWLHQQK